MKTATDDKPRESDVSQVVPRGILKKLKPEEIKPSRSNPRQLFDPIPLKDLKENIRQHGVLVPITVYEVKGQKKYAILDGERRYRCCLDLKKEGLEITIPANIVEPPDKIAGILYMFSIHNFRQQWELMPTAQSLKIVIEALEENDTKRLVRFTGLSEPQVERCKVLLTYPERFQNLSLDPDPKTRIPSNFWIEAYPILNLCETVLPDLVGEIGRDGITDKFVEKYRSRKIKSVIHFRRISEAFDFNEDHKEEVIARLREYILDINVETRKAFDEFVIDSRHAQGTIKACDDFVSRLERSKLEHVVEGREELINALERVKKYADALLQKLEGSDAPPLESEVQKEEGE